jgi:hypothetical protein
VAALTANEAGIAVGTTARTGGAGRERRTMGLNTGHLAQSGKEIRLTEYASCAG